MMWPPYPICLDTSKHEDVECSLCIDMKTFGTLILQQSKVDASLFVFCPCSRTYHPMHDIDLSESLKIRTTVCLVFKHASRSELFMELLLFCKVHHRCI